MTFWILTLLLAFIAMGFVCFPLIKSSVTARSELDSEQVLYEARLAEIEKDLELGRLDQITAQAAKSEEARRLIKSSETAVSSTATSKNKALIILAAFSVPLFSLPFYYQTGAHHFTSPTVAEVTTTTPPSMEDLLKVAEQRLKTNPDDISGWKVVAPVYVRMGRFADALNAYENVLRVEGRNPETLIRLADVHIEQAQGQINPQAKQLIQEVLSIDKDNSIAVFYTGIIALQNDNLDETRNIWQGMLDNSNGNEEWLPVVKGRLAELSTLQQPTVKPDLPELDQDTVKAIQELEPEDRLDMIGQMVSNLDEKLKENPNNKEGWQRLIRSYIILDRSEDAKVALENASKHFSDDTAFIASLENIIQSVKSSSKGNVQ